MKKRTLGSSPYFFAISHCFISSREKIMIRFGLYFFNVIGTKVFPNDPVPPVIRMLLFSSILVPNDSRSEEHTSELQSLMRTSFAVFCLNKKNTQNLPTKQHKNPQQQK